MTTTAAPRILEYPYVFAYDITDDDRRKEVLKCIKRWRLDGQYSVHETWLRPFQMRDLSVALTDLIDQNDSLLVCRLDKHKSSPLYQMYVKSTPTVGKPPPAPIPQRLSTGEYMICYDIREQKRLQRIQRLTAKHTIYLQRSVYLYRGKGNPLISLIEKLRPEMNLDDDLRIYNLAHIKDMWFLSEDKPAIPEMMLTQTPPKNPSMWQRLLNWVKK